METWRGVPSGDSMEADLELMLLEGRPKGQGGLKEAKRERARNINQASLQLLTLL